MAEPAGAAILEDVARANSLPDVLADSPAVGHVLELVGAQWVLPNAEGARPEQAQVVWVSLVAYGEDFAVDRVLIALPGRGEEDSVAVPVAPPYGPGHPPISVRFIEGNEETFLALMPSTHAGSACLVEDVFAPGSGGFLWPSATALVRRAPRPEVMPMLFIQITDLGAQFALAGDAMTDGFITGDDGDADATIFNQLADDEEEDPQDNLPLVSGPGRGRGRGRGAAGQGGAPSPGKPARSPRGAAGAGAGGRKAAGATAARPPQGLLEEIRSAVREELGVLSSRVAALETVRAPSPPPGLRAAATPFDPLFGTGGGPSQGRGYLNAAQEAQQLLRMGAGSPVLGARPGALRSPAVALGAAAPASAGDARRRVKMAASEAPVPEAAGGGMGATLERIASALEAARLPNRVESDLGGAGSLNEYMNLLGGAVGGDGGGGALTGVNAKVGGLWALERIKRTRRERPELVMEAAESIAREQLGVLGTESWNWRRHTEQELLPLCGNFTTLKRMLAILSAALDEGRTYGLPQQQAFLQHAYKVMEATARDPHHEMQWSWPLLGITDPAGRKRPNWAPGEAAALVAYHRDEAALEDSKKKLTSASGRDAPWSGAGAGGDASDASTPWWKKKAEAKAKAQGSGAGAAAAKAAAKAAASPP